MEDNLSYVIRRVRNSVNFCLPKQIRTDYESCRQNRCVVWLIWFDLYYLMEQWFHGTSLNSMTGSVCLYQIFKRPYLYHFWLDLDGRNTVGNHTRRVILISEFKITFRAATYTNQRRQMIKSIVTSNQWSATPFLETSKDHIYITSGRILTVEVLL